MKGNYISEIMIIRKRIVETRSVIIWKIVRKRRTIRRKPLLSAVLKI